MFGNKKQEAYPVNLIPIPRLEQYLWDDTLCTIINNWVSISLHF